MFHTVDKSGPLSITEIYRSLVFRKNFWKYFEKPNIFLSFSLPILGHGLLNVYPHEDWLQYVRSLFIFIPSRK